MFCSRCGAPLSGGNFCQSCGQPVGAPAPVPTPTPVPTPIPAPVPAPPSSPYPAIAVVKQAASSPLFLCAVILTTLSAILSLIFSIAGVDTAATLLGEFNVSLGEEMPVNSFSAATIVGAIIGMIPQLLLILGLWMTYAAGRNKTLPTMETGGLSLVKGLLVFYTVLMGLAAVLLVLCLVLIAVMGMADQLDSAFSEFSLGDGLAAGILVAVFAICTVAIVLVFVFYIKSIKSVNAALSTLRTGVPSSRVSLFVAVWCFISAAGSLMSLLSTSFLVVLCSIGSQVLFGIVLIQYREKMQQLERAMYAAPPAPVNGSPVL